MNSWPKNPNCWPTNHHCLVSAITDDDKLDFTIDQRRVYDQKSEPLTVRTIIDRIVKIWGTATKLSAAERAFLRDFAAAKDRGLYIEDSFLFAAVEGGRTLKTHTMYIHHDEGKDEDGGWLGLSRFFGMYVVNCTEYGEGQEEYGPFAKKKDAKAVYDTAVAFATM